MNMLIALTFISFILALLGLVLFFYFNNNRDLTLLDQISLYPLEDDEDAKTDTNSV